MTFTIAVCRRQEKCASTGRWPAVCTESTCPTTVGGVNIDHPATLNALSAATRGTFGQLTLGNVCGDDRALTTQLAQVIREAVLDDGSLPLGINFPSKTAYGRCLAWWNRRVDDNLTPGRNDPKLVKTLNVGVPELYEICEEWILVLISP